MVLGQHAYRGGIPQAGVVTVMAKEQKSEDVLCDLVRQAIDDVRFHVGAAFAMVELGYIEDAVNRLDRALSAYQEASTEFLDLQDTIGVRRKNLFVAELDDASRKLWIVTRDISKVARTSILLYNQMRRLRRSFLICGGAHEGATRAAGGRS